MTTLVETGILTVLQASAALVALVSTRIYLGWLPQNCAYPALCFFEVSGNELQTAPIARSRFQFSSFAVDDITSKRISNAVIAALKDYSGIPGAVHIPKTIYLGRNRFYEEDTKLFHYATEMQILHKEN